MMGTRDSYVLKIKRGAKQKDTTNHSKEYTSLRLINILDSYDGDLARSQVEATLSF